MRKRQKRTPLRERMGAGRGVTGKAVEGGRAGSSDARAKRERTATPILDPWKHDIRKQRGVYEEQIPSRRIRSCTVLDRR